MYQKGMVRQMGTLKCPEYMSKEEFKKWWLGTHAELGKHTPGLKWYTVLFTLENTPLGTPPFDGYAEIWFENVEALKKAYDSDVMKKGFEDLKKHKLDDPNLLQGVWAEEYIIQIPQGPKSMPFQKGMVRQMGTLKCPEYMSKEEFKKWWFETHAENGKHLPGLKWYTVLFTLENTPFGTPPFDGYAEIWFENVEALKKAYDSDVMKKGFEDLKKHKLDDPNLLQGVWAEEYIIQIPHE